MNLKKFQVGDVAFLTEESFQNIVNSSKSIHVYPSQSFVNQVKNYVGQSCVISCAWDVGYDVTVKFSDGQHFHFKGNWISENKS
jgi:hypothetical protein